LYGDDLNSEIARKNLALICFGYCLVSEPAHAAPFLRVNEFIVHKAKIWVTDQEIVRQ